MTALLLMGTTEIICEVVVPIVLFILILVALCFVCYYKTLSYLKEQALKEIEENEEGANEADGNGQEQLEEVVSNLYKLIPTIMKPFITEKLLTKLVQKLFDQVKKFAEKQANKTK